MSPRQVREVLGCRMQLVTDLIDSGMLPCIHFGRICRVRSSTLDCFLLSMEGKDIHAELARGKEQAAFSVMPGAGKRTVTSV